MVSLDIYFGMFSLFENVKYFYSYISIIRGEPFEGDQGAKKVSFTACLSG